MQNGTAVSNGKHKRLGEETPRFGRALDSKKSQTKEDQRRKREIKTPKTMMNLLENKNKNKNKNKNTIAFIKQKFHFKNPKAQNKAAAEERFIYFV